MAYENYNFVSWSDGSPLSSNRLGQMSINIEQVKEVVDDKSQGILRFNQRDTQFPNSIGYSTFGEFEVIALKDEGGGVDRRVTIEADRYYKVVLNVPAITISGRGAEDSMFAISLYEGSGLSDPTPTKIAFWQVTPSIYGFINVNTSPTGQTFTVSNVVYPAFTVKSNTNTTKIGAGTYSIVRTTPGTKVINQPFFATVQRIQGASSNNAPSWLLEANSASPIQLYVEDVGGI